MIPEKVFADLSVTTVVDLFELPPVTAKVIFSRFSARIV